MKRNKHSSKPNRAARNAVARISYLQSEASLQRSLIDEQGGDVSGYCDRYGDTGATMYGQDRAALRKVERELSTLTH